MAQTSSPLDWARRAGCTDGPLHPDEPCGLSSVLQYVPGPGQFVQPLPFGNGHQVGTFDLAQHGQSLQGSGALPASYFFLKISADKSFFCFKDVLLHPMATWKVDRSQPKSVMLAVRTSETLLQTK